jgi:glutamyl-tRNA reductase
MPVVLVGLNHITAPIALRERLYLSGAQCQAFLTGVRALPGVQEAVAVSTCNRTEVYAVADAFLDLVDWLALTAHLPATELLPHLYLQEDTAAISHLFEVASGLDSLVMGEMQILGQLREALAHASAGGTVGRVLSTLFQHALATGKRARAETAISAGAFSVGRAAVELARTLFPNLRASPVLVLGAGTMSELTARHLSAHGVQTIFVANRTHAHAQELAERLGGFAIHYDNLQSTLVEVDILISATSAPHYVLHAQEIAQVMHARAGRPLCLIDIALPRDIDPAAGDLPEVHLYNVDALQTITKDEHYRRLCEIPKVKAIISEEVDHWQHRLAAQDAAPVIAALRHSFEEIRQAELARQASALGSLSPEQRASVDYLTTALINKLLHTPTVRLKEALAQQASATPLELLCTLFDLAHPASELESS